MGESLGRQLHEVLGWPGPMTHRQFRTWAAWREEDKNHPSRTDWYLMALRADVYRAQGGKAEVGKMRLEFKEPTPPVDPKFLLTKERIAIMRRQHAEHQARQASGRTKAHYAPNPAAKAKIAPVLPPAAKKGET